MERQNGVILILIAVAVMAGSALLESVAYITDFLGEILIVCGIPLVLALVIWGGYKMLQSMAMGRAYNLEHQIMMVREELINEKMRRDLDVIQPTSANILPVARHLIETGQVAEQSIELLSKNIDANRTHAPVPQTLTYSPHYSNKVDNNGVEAPPAVSAISPLVTEMSKDLLRPDSIYMGHKDGEALYVPPHKLKSMVCGGQSGSGKSNTTRLLLMQYANMGWQLAITDPHGNSEEGILPSLMPLSGSFFMPPAKEFDEGFDMLRCIVAEGERRKSFEGSKASDFSPLLYVVDEVAEFINFCTPEERQYVQSNLPIILNSYRKFNIYALCISQFWSKSYMGDLGFILRRSAQTSLIHRMDHDSTKVIERSADSDMVDNFQVGECLLNNTGIKHAKLNIPLCEMGHIEAIVGTAGSSANAQPLDSRNAQIHQIEEKEIHAMAVDLPVQPPVQPDVPTATTDEEEIYLDAAAELAQWQRMEIERYLKNGDGTGQIIINVFEHKNKTNDRKGRKYARMINGVRLELGMPLPYSPARKSSKKE